MTRRIHAFGLLLATAAFAIVIWDVDRPALWLDESASVVATQRTWPNLWHLLDDADAPLVPYYALLKAATSAVTGLFPGTATTPELLFRIPSLVASVLVAWALAVWLARRGSIVLALSAGTALLLTGGFSRYGQEARPYAFVMLAAVIATIMWTTMVSNPRRRWIVVYALSVSLLLATHLLAGSLVAAHLIAALIASPNPTSPETTSPDPTSPNPTSPDPTPHAPSRWSQRRSAFARTLLGAVLGLAVVAPFAWPASGHAVGPTKIAPTTWDHLSTAFVDVFTDTAGATVFTVSTDRGPFLGVGVLLLLAAVGLIQVFLRPHRFVARVAATWAIVPPLVLLPLVLSRPNLIMGRYLVFIVPGWAILTGLGVVTIVELVLRVSGRRAVVRAIAGGLAVVVVLGTMIASQVGTLTAVRTLGAHSEDIRPVIAAADRPEYATLPIFMTSVFSSLELAAYHRADEARLVGQRLPRDQASIWPVPDAQEERLVGEHRRVVLLLRDPSPARCKQRSPGPTDYYVWRCMPRWLRTLGYKVEIAEEVGYRWTFAVLARPANTPAERIAASAEAARVTKFVLNRLPSKVRQGKKR